LNTYYDDLLASARVSLQTREVLRTRGRLDPSDYVPVVFSVEQLRTLRALAGRVLPQDARGGSSTIDLAARLDQKLAEGKGDGWRYAVLPADTSAYSTALDVLNQLAERLHGSGFTTMTPAMQDAMLESITVGTLDSAEIDLKRWFEDVRADLTTLYVSHPETLARMNYSGIADDPNGFVQLGVGKLEEWEPR
jgi:hypothetical protein